MLTHALFFSFSFVVFLFLISSFNSNVFEQVLCDLILVSWVINNNNNNNNDDK